jgi:hypothetical protein
MTTLYVQPGDQMRQLAEDLMLIHPGSAAPTRAIEIYGWLLSETGGWVDPLPMVLPPRPSALVVAVAAADFAAGFEGDAFDRLSAIHRVLRWAAAIGPSTMPEKVTLKLIEDIVGKAAERLPDRAMFQHELTVPVGIERVTDLAIVCGQLAAASAVEEEPDE